MTVLAEPIRVTLEVIEVLRKLGVRYLVGGSLASSLHGIPRATQDVDLVVDLHAGQVEEVVRQLENGFYVDGDMIIEAIRRRASFNIIHLQTMLKIDIFLPRSDPFCRSELERASAKLVEGHEMIIATAEDIVIEKLRWYELGGGISDRQWSDVVGVLKVQGERLDWLYLITWAEHLELGHLLDRARQDAGLSANTTEK